MDYVSKKARAQSAMEFLMTYGWAILIIAVVLVVLFRLGIFSGIASFGTSCLPSSEYLCSISSLGTNGNLSFTLGQASGAIFYNIGLACAASSTSDGLLPSPTGSMVYVSGTGAATGTPANAPAQGAMTIQTAQTISVSGLKCFDSKGNPVVTSSTTLPIGQSYGGFLWINYTLNSGAPGGSNPMITAKIATIVAQVT